MLPRQRFLCCLIGIAQIALVFASNPWPTENETSRANIELHTGAKGRFAAIFSCQGKKCSILLSRICDAANVSGLPSVSPRLVSTTVTAEAISSTATQPEARTTTFAPAPQPEDKRKGKKAFSKYFKKMLPKKMYKQQLETQEGFLSERIPVDEFNNENMVDDEVPTNVKSEMMRVQKKMNLFGESGYKKSWNSKGVEKDMYRFKRQAKPAVPAVPAKPAAPAAAPAKPGAPAAPLPAGAKPGVPAALPAKPGAALPAVPAKPAVPALPAAAPAKPGAPPAPAALPAKPGLPAAPVLPGAKPGLPVAPAAGLLKPGAPAPAALPLKPGAPVLAPALGPPKPGLVLGPAAAPPKLMLGAPAAPGLALRPLVVAPVATMPPAAPAWVPVFGPKPAGTPAPPVALAATAGYAESEGPTEDLEAMFKAAEKEMAEGATTPAANPFNLDGLVGGFLGGLAGGIGPSSPEAAADATPAAG